VSNLPPDKRRLVENLHRDGEILAGKRALIVDDDIRNIFAMTSFLERYEMTIHAAENGLEAIELLSGAEQYDVILMDIMMPDMDGYETMRRIRDIPAHRDLPILALTAKAMKGDREKCIEAGASDYIAKPVDTEHLVSLLRIWLHR
jgi:CheY-like chemotaxis protein